MKAIVDTNVWSLALRRNEPQELVATISRM